jgi:outer membrane receptor for ferrienterochelin and colicins
VEAYSISRQPLEDNPYRETACGYLSHGIFFEKVLGRFRIFANAENLGHIRQTSYDPLVRPAPLPDRRWTVDARPPFDSRLFNARISLTF